MGAALRATRGLSWAAGRGNLVSLSSPLPFHPNQVRVEVTFPVSGSQASAE
jgi:hypothetical protein